MTKVKAIKAEVGRGQLFIERSFKKPTRTTLRIREDSHGPKKLFVEVTENQHPDHERIVKKIFTAYRNGDINSKEDAACLKRKLVESDAQPQ